MKSNFRNENEVRYNKQLEARNKKKQLEESKNIIKGKEADYVKRGREK